jgi:OOP family OmpA-OmpF porin
MKLLAFYLRLTVSACLLVAVSIQTHAQTVDQKNGIGVYYGLQKYAGNAGNEYEEFSDSDFMAGMHYSRYLSPFLDFGLSFAYARLDFYDENFDGSPYTYVNEIYNGNLHFKVKFLRTSSVVRPYLMAGFGVNYNDVLQGRTRPVDTRDRFATPNVPVGLGLRFRLDHRVTFDVETTWNKVFDNFDLEGTDHDKDAFMFHTIGFTYQFGRRADADNDGVLDAVDRCPATPSTARVDKEGCPLDSDSDGVADFMDRCPSVAGLENFDGCPDTDRDGVEDAFDRCPQVAGDAKFYGCPDTDGDGVADDADRCPNQKGLCQFDGCPDRDGDGVPDAQDQCPDVVGTLSNKGCPEIKESDIEAINRNLEKVYFDFNKYEVKPTSFEALNRIVNILSENPSYKVLIEAHADNVGSDAYNSRLSIQRGDAVKNYLVANGIGETRITVRALGESRPASSNATTEGRALNRRVEFTVRL